MQITKSIMLVFISVIFLSSCCKLPFFDCGPRISKILIKPETINFENGHIKSCMIKGWLLRNRNNDLDSCTVDLEMTILYDTFLNLNGINPIHVFKDGNYYLKVGDQKFNINPTEIKIDKIPSTAKSTYSEIKFYFSFLVDKNEFINTMNTKSLELKELSFPGERISIAVNLKVNS